jgi:signal transduction histidine kinase
VAQPPAGVVGPRTGPGSIRGWTPGSTGRAYARTVETRQGWTVWDWAPPAAIAALVVAEVLTLRPDGWPVALLLMLTSCVVLVGRRRWPLAACVTAGVVALTVPWAGPELNDLASPVFVLVLVAWSLARWLPGHRQGALGLAALVSMLVLAYVFTDERDSNIGDVLFASSLLVPPYVFGKVSRRLAEQSALVASQSLQLRDQAVRDERDRIARELHDVIAHSVSAMVVQTAAAQDLVARDPARATAMLEAVAETGRRALAETGRLLHTIRDEGDELGLAPAPGLADVPALLRSVGEAGLDVEADLALPASPLPSGVDVSVYRVTQEALTNALRYGTGRARLAVHARDGVLRIECDNPVAGGAAHPGAGLGLQGIAERVRLLGGTLDHGAEGGHYRLVAVVPLGADS